MNFARNLRPKTFEQVVGQPLIKSMLKNSLFLGKMFPAYLFAGERGCGKTTVARIFASALNCKQLVAFQQNPKSVLIPCLACDSCLAMQQGCHPDFFEIDAASNTGVDNVRQILETAAYQPTLGIKRIFLLDEVHMLSKSAFNALLKMLEEPPKTVVFLMATTELEKVPATIRSRAFLGLFPRVEPSEVVEYLKKVCSLHKLVFDDAAILLIAKLGQGCLRDCLNLLDQLSALDQPLTASLVEKTFFHAPKELIVKIAFLLVNSLPEEMSQLTKSVEFDFVTANSLYDELVEVFDYLLSKKLNPELKDDSFYGHDDRLLQLAEKTDVSLILHFMETLWQSLEQFNATTQKMMFLRYLLVKLSQKKTFTSDGEPSLSKNPVLVNAPATPQKAPVVQQEKKTVFVDELMQKWKDLLELPEIKKEGLLLSVLSSVVKIELPVEKVNEIIAFSPRVNKFFISVVADFEEIVKQALQKIFAGRSALSLAVVQEQAFVAQKKNFNSELSFGANLPTKRPINPEKGPFVSNRKVGAASLDFSDKNKWPIVNLLIERFPGKIIIDND